MSRRETGLFGRIYNALTGTGVTVTRTTDFWGNPRTVVHNYNTGTTKEYTHRKGFFSNRTDVRVKRQGREIGRGAVRRSFTGKRTLDIEYTEGRVRRHVGEFNQGFFGNKTQHTYYEGQGSVAGVRKGHRSLIFNRYTQEYTGVCFRCNGTGIHRSGQTCRK